MFYTLIKHAEFKGTVLVILCTFCSSLDKVNLFKHKMQSNIVKVTCGK